MTEAGDKASKRDNAPATIKVFMVVDYL